MVNIEALHLNLVLRQMSKRAAAFVSDQIGLTVISTKTRDKILNSAPWLSAYFPASETNGVPNRDPSSGVADPYLRWDHPFLESLRRHYARHPAADHSQWNSPRVLAGVNPASFRADNLYVFQSRRYPPSATYATAAYTAQVDRLGLFQRLEEDGAFGAETFDFHGKLVSRDLLESILEINFLDRHVELSHWRDVRILDIGAGYGRLAHRAAAGLPNLGTYFCVDAVPESSFLSDYYLKFRDATDHCCVVPLHEFGDVGPIDLCVSIHCFTECRSRVVKWWLGQIREVRVPWLFIESGCTLGLTSREERGRGDIRRLIEGAGFTLAVKEKKFASAPVLEAFGLYPADYYLFRRN
jgi:hypothetical protein